MNGTIIKIFEDKLENIAKLNQKENLLTAIEPLILLLLEKRKN